MKYIHSVMAGYIKPLMKIDQRIDSDIKDKMVVKDEEKKNCCSGMGDFEYHNLPLNVASEIEEEQFDEIRHKTENILSKLDDELAQNFEERKCLETRINNYEGELQKRKNLYDLCTALCNEELKEIEKCSENIRRFDSTINYHEEVLDSWQCLMNEFRKIPEDCL
ncbi:hypothetical protein JTB14_032245 [Gonioctena quinquepunctata]|nr:hypothetical protein JTB14_032245 [Gonioctena quinquepunctata]